MEKRSKDCQARTFKFRDAECFIPILKQFDHERNPDKYYKILKSHRPTGMNESESSF